MGRLGFCAVTAAIAAAGLVSACAALWGFEPGDAGAATASSGGGGSGGQAGSGGSAGAGGADGGTGGSAGAGGTPFVQHQEGSIDVSWDFGGATGFFNVDQYFCFEQLGAETVWRTDWSWTDHSYGGYTLIEASGRRLDESIGPTVVFSLAQATDARSAPCEEVPGEEPGRVCRVPYELNVGHCYRMRVWRLEADADGQWWGCWIMDRATPEQEVLVGSIRAPLDAFTMGPSHNVVAYVGPAVGCDAVPIAVALLGSPGGDQTGADTYATDATYATSSIGACTGGLVEAADLGWRPGVRVRLGGAI